MTPQLAPGRRCRPALATTEPAPPPTGDPADDAIHKVHVEVTTRCNLDCAMCVRHVWQEPPGDMSADTFGALVEQLAALPGPQTVQLAGFGEPLLHPAVLTFIGQAAAAGIATELVTNGALLTVPLGLELLEVGLQHLILSVGGPGEGCASSPGLDPEVRRTLVKLRRATFVGGALWPLVTIHVVIGHSNLPLLGGLRSLAGAVGAQRISVSHLLPHTPEMAEEALFGARLPACSEAGDRGGTPHSPEVALPPMEWRPAEAQALGKLLAGQSPVTMGRTRLDLGGSFCPFVQEGRLAINWRGEVAPCLPLLHTHEVVTRGRTRAVREWLLGSIRQAPLPHLWAEPAYVAFRERVRRFAFPPCPECGTCELALSNETDCFGNPFPTCGDCLYARGLVRCP